ncbi:MAG TPA: YIP1 family protein [Candidatus Eremiobacteraceae bacterium]|nr:YIP1 family protein [Candidatus Eremiobacteraceae bacterium]
MDQPQPTVGAPAERASGLATYFGVLFSPAEAFETLSRVPMWGWACILGMIISLVAAIIGLPATMHIAQVAQQTAIAQAPADRQQAMRDGIRSFAPFMGAFVFVSVFIVTWVIWLVSALFTLAATAVGRGTAKFANAWALAVNLYAIPALGSLIANIILRLQGPENINKQSDAFVLPSPAMVVHGDAKLAAFLYAFNVINLWLFAVFAIALQRTMKVGSSAAWVAAVVLALLSALLAMAFAK